MVALVTGKVDIETSPEIRECGITVDQNKTRRYHMLLRLPEDLI